MLKNVKVLNHSSIKIKGEKMIYIDPFKIEKNYQDADIIFITHDHYDHYSEEDIEKIKKESTKIVIPQTVLKEKVKKEILEENIITVRPNEELEVEGIKCKTVPAYNVNKKFHPKENNWVGYIFEFNESIYYIAGDTDINNDNIRVKCDVAFVPIGGTFTMDYKEAAEFINKIKPKVAVPIHYGSIVGTKKDAENFIKLLDKDIKGIIML